VIALPERRHPAGRSAGIQPALPRETPHPAFGHLLPLTREKDLECQASHLGPLLPNAANLRAGNRHPTTGNPLPAIGNQSSGERLPYGA
jgi:hypothetical protein